MNLTNKMSFVILSFAIATLMISAGNSISQQTFTPTFAQQENEAEVEADIEQENKCKKDTECENENELNNQLSIVNKTQGTTESSLTVKKEIFGCDNIEQNGAITMNCNELQNDSPLWLPCTDPTISSSSICQSLPENFFDIEVLDDQDSQIQQFKGSSQGTTINIIESGTYVINEIIHPSSDPDQLNENDFMTQSCADKGFSDGGLLSSTQGPGLGYAICFEYEDEQGNDCSQTIVNEGENNVCIVKNYITLASNAG